MQKLVIHGSKYGSTEEYARAIAMGIGCDAITAQQALDDPYNIGSTDLLVIGTAVYGDRAHPEIEELISNYSMVLSHRIIALFVVCLNHSENPGDDGQPCGTENIEKIASLLPNPPVAMIILPGRIIRDMLDDEDSRKIGEFYAKIGVPFEDRDCLDIDAIKPFIRQLSVFK
jgi:menaquinone-dependent protoporphyrinogen IX oxidase